MKKKIISAVALIAMLAFVFSGCKDKTEDEVSAEFGVLTKVGDKLYEVTFDKYAENYVAANKYYSSEYATNKNHEKASECTCIYKNGILMRNLDWYIKQDNIDICETVIRTTANEGRYATIGVMKNLMITDETYDKLSDKQLKMLPFALSDGMNSEGLMFGQNACPAVDEISVTSGTNPNGEDLVVLMAGREILDYCASVDEAVELLKSKNFYVFTKDNVSANEVHFLVADKERAVIIEFVDNKMVVLEQKDFPYNQIFCTNHYLFNGGVNTGHGSGYERDEIIKDNYDSITDWQSGMKVLEKVKYSQMYTIPISEKFWYSEFYGVCKVGETTFDFNCNSPKDDPVILKIINNQIEAYGRRESDCWWTSHSSVYDLSSHTLHLAVRENYDKIYDFSLLR